jgi:hypothetical protein
MEESKRNLLGGFPLSEGEQKGIEIAVDSVQDLWHKGSKCLVGRLGVPKKLNKEAFKAILLRIWRPVGTVLFKEVQENLWLFEFEEEADKQKVMAGRPWSYDRTLLILNEFDGRLAPDQLDFTLSPIWVQIHNMPLGCMNRAVGTQIGSTLGKVEEVAIAEDDVGWGRFLRVRVMINLFKPLERGRTLFVAGNTCWISFKYEKLPVFCFKCGCIIHGLKGCPEINTRKTNHGELAEGWGLWLRADEAFRRTATEGKKPDGSSSPVCSGHDQTEEPPKKESPGKEETEGSAESVPIPYAETFSNFTKVGFGDSGKPGKSQESQEKGSRQDGKSEVNQETTQRRKPKSQSGIPQLQLSGNGKKLGVNPDAKGVFSAKGEPAAAKGCGKGKYNKRGGLLKSTPGHPEGTGWSSGPAGQAKLAYKPKPLTEKSQDTHSLPDGASTRGSPQAANGPQPLSAEDSTHEDTLLKQEPPQKILRKRKDRDSEENCEGNSSPIIPVDRYESEGERKKRIKEVEEVSSLQCEKDQGDKKKADTDWPSPKPVQPKSSFFASDQRYELSLPDRCNVSAVAVEQPRRSP